VGRGRWADGVARCAQSPRAGVKQAGAARNPCAISAPERGTPFDPVAGMPSMLVTCPETAHLENIEYEDHPLGMLIYTCTRFEPSCAIHCQRTCAARLDRKRRQLSDDDDTVIEIVRAVIDFEP
jgi:hypothetical protein